MGSGDFGQRMRIEGVTRAANAMNEVEETWAATGNRWAKVEGKGGREMQRAMQTTPAATHLVTMRSDSLTKELTTDDRLVWTSCPGGSLTLGIVNVDKSRAREGEIVCLCEAAG